MKNTNFTNTRSEISSFSEFIRPRTLDELTLPIETIKRLQAMIDSQNVMNMIFYGSPGTGKTTCANIIVNSAEFDFIFINASLKNSMNVVKDVIEPYTTSMSLYQSKKIVLLDEAEFLTESAQASLRGVIEQSTANCRFILTANKLSKIHPAIQSRCLPICFDLPLPKMPEAIAKVSSTVKNRIAEINEVIDDMKLDEIVRLSYPDYRTIANKIEFEML
jgi:replication-associated recombination protein RarA